MASISAHTCTLTHTPPNYSFLRFYVAHSLSNTYSVAMCSPDSANPLGQGSQPYYCCDPLIQSLMLWDHNMTTKLFVFLPPTYNFTAVVNHSVKHLVFLVVLADPVKGSFIPGTKTAAPRSSPLCVLHYLNPSTPMQKFFSSLPSCRGLLVSFYSLLSTQH